MRGATSVTMLLETLLNDSRYAVRSLSKRPGFAAVAILTLAIGMGVCSIAFTAVNAFFIKRLAARDVPGAGWILMSGPDEGQSSLREYEALSQNLSRLQVAGEFRTPVSYRGPGVPEALWSLAVSRNYFDLVDVRPLAGRLFGAAFPSSPEVLVSERFWRDRLDSAPLSSLALNLNGIDVPLIGILPEDHHGPGGLFDPDVWIPLDAWRTLKLPERARAADARPFALFGRLAPGASRAQADGELGALAIELQRLWPETNARRNASFVLFREGRAEMRALAFVADAASLAVGLVLLIALFNFAGLLLGRGAARRKELSLRSALGASRMRLVRQLLAENMVLAAVSGVLALILSFWSAALLRWVAPPSPIPVHLDLTPDTTMLVFIAALAGVCGILPGLLPAWRATGVSPIDALKEEGPAGGKAASRTILVMVQIAGATLLFKTAGLFIQSVLSNHRGDLGFERDRAIVLELDPSAYGHNQDGARGFIGQVLDRIRALPGVTDASIADRISFYIGFPRQMEVSTDGRSCVVSNDCAKVTTYNVGPRYFRTMGIPVRRGREFDGSPNDAQSAVVSQFMAERFSSSGDLLGRWISIGKEGRSFQVIGIAADVTHRVIGETPAPYIYLPFNDAAFANPVTIVARTSGDPDPLVTPVRDAVGGAEGGMPSASVKTMRQHLERAFWAGRTVAGFFTVCGLLAAFLSTVGLFGAISYSVGQRTREFAIRLAIGETRRGLAALVLRDGLRLSLPGLVLGLLGAAASMQVLRSVLTALDAPNPLTYVLVALLQAAVVAIACLAPARRASQVNPMAAMRTE